MEILQTSRLKLRTWTAEDLYFAVSIWGDPEVMKYVDLGLPQSIDQIKCSIDAGISHQNKFGYQHWAVIEKQTDRVIGACGFNKTEEPEELEIVFHFSKSSWGKGFATEAAFACIDYATKNISPKKIIAGCHPDNEGSRKVLEKIGFQFVGSKWFDDTQREEPCFELIR